MSALEKLKEKLRSKPNVEEMSVKQVEVVIPIPNKPEEVKFSMVTIQDKRKTSGFNMEDLTKKLKEKRLTKLVVSPTAAAAATAKAKYEEPLVPALPTQASKTKKPAKLSTKKLQILQEEGIPILEGPEVEDLGEETEPQNNKTKGKKDSKIVQRCCYFTTGSLGTIR